MPSSDHDATVGSDPVTTLTINYEWRRFLAYAIHSFFDRANSVMDATQQDTFEPRFSNFFDDLFTDASTPMTLIAAKVRRATAQSQTGAGVETTFSFTSEDYDYGDFWDIGTPEKLIVPTGQSGLYQVTGNFELSHLGGGTNRWGALKVNNSTVVSRVISGTALRVGFLLSGDVELVAGDEITMHWNAVGFNNATVVDGVDATLSLIRIPDGT